MSEEIQMNLKISEHLQTLNDIKAECEKINKELIGSKDIGEETSGESVDEHHETSVRERLEKIFHQMRLLKPLNEVDPASIHERFPLAPDDFLSPKIEFGEPESTGDKIRSEIDGDEQNYLLEQFNATVTESEEIAQGASIIGKTPTSILESIPNQFAVVVQIGNYLDHNLQGLSYFMPTGSFDLPQVIEYGTVEALMFSSPGQWMNGLFSYCIVEANLRLVVWLLQNSNHLAVALAPMKLITGNNSFAFEGAANFSNLWKIMADRRWVTWSKDPMTVTVWNGDILAKVVFTGGPKSLLEIDICNFKFENIKTEDAVPFHKPKSLQGVVDGKSIVGKSILDISQYILGPYGYILEIVNLLHVALNEPASYLENGQQPFSRPEMVSGGSREVLIVKMNNSGKGAGGLVSFRIGTTDLRLVVAFQIFNNGNKFGSAFIPSNFPTDASLMVYLTSDDQWSTSPDRKFGMAKDGPLVIQTRNIRAKVSMTEGLKVALNIVVKTC